MTYSLNTMQDEMELLFSIAFALLFVLLFRYG